MTGIESRPIPRGAEDQKHAVEIDRKGGGILRPDFNTFLLLVIAIEIALIYVKLPRK
jgi:hypothetical protein